MSHQAFQNDFKSLLDDEDTLLEKKSNFCIPTNIILEESKHIQESDEDLTNSYKRSAVQSISIEVH